MNLCGRSSSSAKRSMATMPVGLTRNANRLRQSFYGRARFLSTRERPTLALIFDTETTGIANFKKPANDPSQPGLVQLGMILVDTQTWTTKLQVSMLINNVTAIHPAAQAVHGISAADCEKYGIPRSKALGLFCEACEKADVLVAHNLAFDKMILEVAACRENHTIGSSVFNNAKQQFCTMHSSTNIIKIPGKIGKQYKWPSLAEAYSYFTNGKTLKGSHDALVDAKACLEVFKNLVDSGSEAFNFSRKVVADKIPSVRPTTNPYTVATSLAIEPELDIVATPGELSLHYSDNSMSVRGNTFRYKEHLKKLGGRWDQGRKAWNFSNLSMSGPVERLVNAQAVAH